jgi:hypothetical protein
MAHSGKMKTKPILSFPGGIDHKDDPEINAPRGKADKLYLSVRKFANGVKERIWGSKNIT